MTEPRMHRTQPEPSIAETDEPKHEIHDANPRTLFAIGFGLIGLIVVVLVIMWGVYSQLKSHPTQILNPIPSQLVQENVVPPGPRLQVNPTADLRDFRAREDSVLSSYGWVDQKNGLARIPIDSAIDRIAREGLSVRRGADKLR